MRTVTEEKEEEFYEFLKENASTVYTNAQETEENQLKRKRLIRTASTDKSKFTITTAVLPNSCPGLKHNLKPNMARRVALADLSSNREANPRKSKELHPLNLPFILGPPKLKEKEIETPCTPFVPTLNMNQIEHIYHCFVNVTSGLNFKERSWRMRKYKCTFFANEMIDWLLAHLFVGTRDEGVIVGKEFVKSGYIDHPTKILFEDSKELFHLTKKARLTRREQSLPLFLVLFDPQFGLELKDRTLHQKKFKSCFSGIEFVDCLIQKKLTDQRSNAERVGREFLEFDLIEHVNQDHHFKDSSLLYNLTHRGQLYITKCSTSKKDIKSKMTHRRSRTDRSNRNSASVDRSFISDMPDTIDDTEAYCFSDESESEDNNDNMLDSNVSKGEELRKSQDILEKNTQKRKKDSSTKTIDKIFPQLKGYLYGKEDKHNTGNQSDGESHVTQGSVKLNEGERTRRPSVKPLPKPPTRKPTIYIPYSNESEPYSTCISIIVRRFSQKRGGVKMLVPDSMKELLEQCSEKLKVQVVCLREASTEAEISHLSLLTPDLLVWAMTEEEETEFL